MQSSTGIKAIRIYLEFLEEYLNISVNFFFVGLTTIKIEDQYTIDRGINAHSPIIWFEITATINPMAIIIIDNKIILVLFFFIII